MAFVITGVLASLAALGAASARVAEASFRPIAIALQVTPIIAIAPLFKVWAGIDHPQRAVVALACVAAFFPIYSGALAGLGRRPGARAAVRPLRRERLATAHRLRLPSAVPQALEGFKVGLGLALVGAVIGEMLAGSGDQQGLALRILEAATGWRWRRASPPWWRWPDGRGLARRLPALERRLTRWWRGR